jgi:hypothetical protein
MTRSAREQWPQQTVGFFEPRRGRWFHGKQIDRQGILIFLNKSERSEKWRDVFLYSSRSIQDVEFREA